MDFSNEYISTNQLEDSNLNIHKKKKRYRIINEDKNKKDKNNNNEIIETINIRSESKKKTLDVKQDELTKKLLTVIIGIKKEREEKLIEEKEKEEKEKKLKEEKEEKLKEEKEKKLKEEKEKKLKEETENKLKEEIEKIKKEKIEEEKRIKEEKLKKEKEENLKKENEKKEIEDKKNEEKDKDEKIENIIIKNENKMEKKEKFEKIKKEGIIKFDNNFHKSRLTKIKFRNFNNIKIRNINDKKFKKEKFNEKNSKELEAIKGSKKNIIKPYSTIEEYLNKSKEIKKKIKSHNKNTYKKEKNKIIENSVNYELNVEKSEEEFSCITEKTPKSIKEKGNKKKRNSKNNINEKKKKMKEKEKEFDIKEAKKDILKKLEERPEKLILEVIDTSTKEEEKKLNDDNINNIPEIINNNYNNFINNADKIKNKSNEANDSIMIKKEQNITSGLIDNNKLNYNERMRREQLERDLASEINNDELTEEPNSENEINFNNKKDEDENGYTSTTKRTYQNTQIFDKETFSDKNKKDSLYNSLIGGKINNNTINYKKMNFKNNIYTPKKALLVKDNSLSKSIQLTSKKKITKKNTNILPTTNNTIIYNNYESSTFNSRNHKKKTKFNIFKENCIKNHLTISHNYNSLNNNLNFDKSGLINYSSLINKNNISEIQKYKLRHNKILYTKKSPERHYLNKTNIAHINYDEKDDNIQFYKPYYTKNESPNGLYIHSFNIHKYNMSKIKKELINKVNFSNVSSEKNVSYQSNEITNTLLNESSKDFSNNTFFTNPNNSKNLNQNIIEKTNSFKRKSTKLNLKKSKKFLPEINLEDLILIENKYFYIIHNLGEKKEIANDCFDLFNYYYNSTICKCLLKFFSEPNVIKLNINYTLMSLLVSYDLSYEKERLKKIYLLLLELFIINYRNLILIIESVTSKINKNIYNSFWINRLMNKIIRYKESQEGEDVDSYSNFGLTIIEKIKYNTHYLMEKIHYILLNYDESNNNTLIFFLKTINVNSYDKINVFFKEKIIRENLEFTSLLASSLIRDNNLPKKPIQPKVPYIPYISKKKFSLVLDLDETLIYMDKTKDESNGTLKIRPGTFLFLEKVKKYFEIIIFSEADQNYVDLVLNSIEENNKYFDYKLYRQHTIIQNDEFIKDLNRIGRKLCNMIIVDNLPQNFRLQPENGIYIKPFWGIDNHDKVLFSLSKILCLIAKEGGDLRDGIKKYRNEIIINVSSSYKEKQ